MEEHDQQADYAIVFFHGGGFVGGDLDEADEFLRHLADASGNRGAGLELHAGAT